MLVVYIMCSFVHNVIVRHVLMQYFSRYFTCHSGDGQLFGVVDTAVNVCISE